MIKVINGIKYNTDTAKELAHYWNGESGARTVSESLYRKRTGAYFIYGYGGALTIYGVPCENHCWSDSSKIFPITQKEAKAWVEKYCTAEEYIEIFGDVEE